MHYGDNILGLIKTTTNVKLPQIQYKNAYWQYDIMSHSKNNQFWQQSKHINYIWLCAYNNTNTNSIGKYKDITSINTEF